MGSGSAVADGGRSRLSALKDTARRSVSTAISYGGPASFGGAGDCCISSSVAWLLTGSADAVAASPFSKGISYWASTADREVDGSGAESAASRASLAGSVSGAAPGSSTAVTFEGAAGSASGWCGDESLGGRAGGSGDGVDGLG